MGRVYTAWDPALRRKVVLKLLCLRDACESVKAHFEGEVRALAMLSNPNVVTIYDFCTVGETCFAVMEYLDGLTLRERMKKGALPVSKCLGIASQISEALAAAHHRGIVHRDVKPENILVAKGERVKLLDFGLSKRCPPVGRNEDGGDAGSEEAGRLVGTVAYMSPEQARGDDVDVHSDIFSFGIVLYEMVTGVHPFARETVTDTLAAIVGDQPAKVPGRSGLRDRLKQFALRCLCKVPKKRYTSCHLARLPGRLHRECRCSLAKNRTVT